MLTVPGVPPFDAHKARWRTTELFFPLHPNDDVPDVPDIPVSRLTRIDSGSAAPSHDEQDPMVRPSRARPTRQGSLQLAVRTSAATSDMPRLRHALPDVNVAVKPEPASQAAPEVLVECPLAQDRTAFFAEVSRYCDLTGHTPRWQMELSAQPALVLSHRMEPDSRLDAAFPLRDPARPLTHVHARYANADGSLSERVSCPEVALDTGFYIYLRNLAAQRDGRLPTLGTARWTALVRSLERDMMSEIQRLIVGTPAQPPRCAPRRLSERDLPAFERAALTGQYGLFVDDALESSQRPLLSNGKVLGVYMGALLETEEELQHYRQEHSTSVQYEMDIDQNRPEPAVVAALGAANSTAFANTALRFDGDRPCYDHERVNAIFLPFRAQMTDNAGQPHGQAFVALVALDNLYASGNPSREVRVDYGDAYLKQFENPPALERTPPWIKTEPLEESREPEDVAMTESAPQAPCARERTPAAAMPAARRRRIDDSGRFQSASSSRRAVDPAAPAERSEESARGGPRRRRVPVRLTIDTHIAHEAWPGPDIATGESSPEADAQGADDTAVIAAIRQAVPGPHRSKTKHYEAILDVNDTRTDGQKWPDKSMQKASGIARTHARTIRNRRAPDTPRTTEARSFLDGSAPARGEDSGLERYRRALNENDRRADEQKWPDKSMQKAAGIAPANAYRVRDRRAPDTPCTTEVRLFLDGSAPAHGGENGFDRYRRVLNENDRRADGQKWSDNSMQKAAGIDPAHAKRLRDRRAPDTPRTIEVRSFLDGSSLAQGEDTGLDRYRRAVDENDTRADDQKWPDKSMQKAAGIDPAEARLLRDRRAPDTPRTAEIRSFLDGSAPTRGGLSRLDRYRCALNENDRRAGDQKWPDKSMRKASGINSEHARMVRDRRAPDTPRTAEARSFMDGSVPVKGEDNGFDRYRRALHENDTRADGQKWPDKSMQKAAGVAPGNARKVRDRCAPDTPRTTEVRWFLDGSAPAQGEDSGFDRYRRALHENDTRAYAQKWPDKSMQKAAGINSVNAKSIRDCWAADQDDPVL